MSSLARSCFSNRMDACAQIYSGICNAPLIEESWPAGSWRAAAENREPGQHTSMRMRLSIPMVSSPSAYLSFYFAWTPLGTLSVSSLLTEIPIDRWDGANHLFSFRPFHFPITRSSLLRRSNSNFLIDFISRRDFSRCSRIYCTIPSSKTCH